MSIMGLLHEMMFVAIAVLSMQPVIRGLVRALHIRNGLAGRWFALCVLQVFVVYRLIEFFQLDASGFWDRFNLF